MTDLQKNLRSYSAFLFKEFGIHYPESDQILPVLYTIHKDMESNNQTNKEIASRIQEVSSRIHPREFNFYSGDAAEKFQNGITRRWILVGILSLILIWGAFLFLSMTNDLNRARIIVGSSRNVNELLQRVEKDNEGYYYLDFSVANGNYIQNFKEFKKINARTVRVYLGKDSR